MYLVLLNWIRSPKPLKSKLRRQQIDLLGLVYKIGKILIIVKKNERFERDEVGSEDPDT